MKKKKTVSAIASIILIISCIGITTAYKMVYGKAIDSQHILRIYIDSDDCTDSIASKVKAHLKPISKAGWNTLEKIYPKRSIKTGYYEISPQNNTLEAFRKINNGLQTPVKLVINNVRTKEQLAGKIGLQLMLDSAEIAKALNDTSICGKYGYTAENFIAMFIPNTYEVYWDTNIKRLLNRMKKEHDAFWNEQRREKAEKIGLTPIEVSILASIVEEETAVNDEKPVIAGLYINRLRIGMPLQADPTVKFAVGDFTLKRILKKHLNVDSPYNTYKNTGLPPGPIRMASITGLNSVLNYSRHKYLYMCAKEDFSGRHNFSTTLSQHNSNARKYQNALNKRNIR